MSSEPSALPGLSAGYATLLENGSKGRYGVAYVKSICAQAGVPMTEPSADEDVLAWDCALDFREAPVRVQVKCTDTFTIRGRSASWPLEEHWIRSWTASRIPVYFVLVIVVGPQRDWVEHPDESTTHRSAAFWCRLDNRVLPHRLSVPKSQRLTAATLDEWHHDLLSAFKMGGAT